MLCVYFNVSVIFTFALKKKKKMIIYIKIIISFKYMYTFLITNMINNFNGFF